MRMVFICVLMTACTVLVGCDSVTEPLITFRNETDETLCYANPEPECAEIKPQTDSHWRLDSCIGEGWLAVYTKGGQRLYGKFADCDKWDDALILIQRQQGGSLVVSDNLP